MLVSCECGKQLNVKDELSGKKVKCPGCGAILTVGAPAVESAPAPTEPATSPGAALGKMAAAGLVVGILAASVAGFISARFFSLIILFPVGLGYAVGVAIQAGAKKCAGATLPLAIAAAAISGTPTYITWKYVDYLASLGKLEAELKEAKAEAIATAEAALAELKKQDPDGDGKVEVEGETMALADLEKEIKDLKSKPVDLDEVFREETGSTGFLGYLKLVAREGISISRSGSGGVPITGMGVWILWLVELLVVAGLPIYLFLKGGTH